jgi:hypothetical protein
MQHRRQKSLINLGLHVEFLQLEIVLDSMKARERLGALDEGLQVVELLTQPAKKFDDEAAIR